MCTIDNFFPNISRGNKKKTKLKMTTNMTSQKDFILHNIFSNSQSSKN